MHAFPLQNGKMKANDVPANSIDEVVVPVPILSVISTHITILRGWLQEISGNVLKNSLFY